MRKITGADLMTGENRRLYDYGKGSKKRNPFKKVWWVVCMAILIVLMIIGMVKWGADEIYPMTDEQKAQKEQEEKEKAAQGDTSLILDYSTHDVVLTTEA